MEHLLIGQDLCKMIGADYSEVEKSLTESIRSNQQEFLRKFTQDPESLDILLIFLCKDPSMREKVKAYIN